VPSYTANLGKKRLPTIPGAVPDLARLPRGCRFQDRCAYAIDVCRSQDPPLLVIEPGHSSACLRAQLLQEAS
jgi:oligopeptide/dipeptide ABC transporter ATP-binding protein